MSQKLRPKTPSESQKLRPPLNLVKSAIFKNYFSLNLQRCKVGKQTNCLVLLSGLSHVQRAALKITCITRINRCEFYPLLWSSISAKNRSLCSILDLLYFMLSYTMRHPTVLISWFNFSIVHGTFCFSHSISRIWHAKLTIFGYFY